MFNWSEKKKNTKREELLLLTCLFFYSCTRKEVYISYQLLAICHWQNMGETKTPEKWNEKLLLRSGFFEWDLVLWPDDSLLVFWSPLSTKMTFSHCSLAAQKTPLNENDCFSQAVSWQYSSNYSSSLCSVFYENSRVHFVRSFVRSFAFPQQSTWSLWKQWAGSKEAD